MHWSRLLFDNECAQRLDIEATRRHVSVMARQNIRARSEMRDRVEELEETVGVLALFSRTLVRILIEKGVMGREELFAALRAIDASDGKADGRYTGSMDTP
jgi:hypothetical protein